jgi:enediyne biosynthesis protein E4
MNEFPKSNPHPAWLASWLFLVTFISHPQLQAAESIEWEDHKEYRIARATFKSGSAPGFSTILAASSGISFKNELSNQRSLERRGLLSGSGVAAGDVDGDGRCDLYFCGLDSSNILYRNLGNWKFEASPPTGGIDCQNTDSTAAAFADIDGDSDLDLIVTASGNGTRLFLNNGSGTFKEATQEAGLSSNLGSMSMALADIDGDQDLDLYVANFRPTTIMDEATTRFSGKNINGSPTVTHVNGQSTTLPIYTNRFIISPSNKILELGQVDQLFINNGKGKFTERSFTGGQFFDESGSPLKEPPRDWGLAVQMRDFTGDGAPDIYVCNDLYTPDRIWINRGDGSFEAMKRLALRNTSTFSMGSDFADIDRDGDLDFFVVDMLSPDHRKRHVQISMSPPRPNPVGQISNRQQILRNTLQLNLGDNSYAEISQLSGLAATDWSWGPIFLDVDLDGFEDILVTNGQLRDFQNVDQARRMESIRQGKKISIKEFRDLIDSYPNLATPNFSFRNQGNLKFEDTSKDWGFDSNGISQGMALGDLDNDGDLDVIQNNLLDFPTLLRNNTSASRIRIQLKGISPNTDGIGARIEVIGGPLKQSQEILGAGRYLSSDEALRTFAGAPQRGPVSINVTWRSGKTTSLSGIPSDSLCEIFESAASPSPGKTKNSENPLTPRFADISSHLKHTHKDEPFNDMERQPLLPNRLSQFGPPIAWLDLDADGWDDLVIGAGRGGSLAAFKNNAGQSFTPIQKRLTKIPSARDYTSIIPWGSNRDELLVGLSNYEDGVASGDAVSLLNWNQDAVRSVVNASPFSFGSLAAADFDQDGDLDLFVAGRVQATRYPIAVDSFLFENDRGTLKLAHTFSKLGMVTGVVFSDLNGDGSPELIVAREWNTLKVFSGDLNQVNDVTQQWQLDQLSGWWNGITAGDFNGDGRMDLVATNWGHNHKYELSPTRPLKLYYGDLDQNGILDFVESYQHAPSGQELPIRSLRTVGLAIPMVRQRMRTFQNYANSNVDSIYGPSLRKASSLTANHLGHTLFLNQGSSFTSKLLSPLSQLAPAFGIAVADFDSDGKEDLFLSQNFFATSPGTHRYDAGRGLILKGLGNGSFSPIPHHESGIAIYGEQRASAVADFNHDGRPDLAVSQNGAQSKLFVNQSKNRGLRITLKGSEENQAAIGAQLRLQNADGNGPTREIHSGAGWLSVDSPTQVLTPLLGETKLWVRWPDGKETQTPLPSGNSSFTVDKAGNIIP